MHEKGAIPRETAKRIGKSYKTQHRLWFEFFENLTEKNIWGFNMGFFFIWHPLKSFHFVDFYQCVVQQNTRISCNVVWVKAKRKNNITQIQLQCTWTEYDDLSLSLCSFQTMHHRLVRFRLTGGVYFSSFFFFCIQIVSKHWQLFLYRSPLILENPLNSHNIHKLKPPMHTFPDLKTSMNTTTRSHLTITDSSHKNHFEIHCFRSCRYFFHTFTSKPSSRSF